MPKTAKPRKRKTRKEPRKTAKLRSHCRCTPTLIAKVCKIVSAGNFRTTAFASLLVPHPTWSRWIHEGRKELHEWSEGQREAKNMSPYADLVLSIEQAEGKCTIGLVKNVTESETEDGRPDVRSREWFLSRRYNKLFTANPAVIVDGEAQAQEEDEHPRGREILLGRILVALGRATGGGDDE